MSPPEVVALDTRGADNKAAFLAAAGACLKFAAYSAGNWDAFEESLRDFVDGHRPVLVVWTGSVDLPAADREMAMQIMGDVFTDGADLLIVDAEPAAQAPDFALDRLVMSIPEDGTEAAEAFWTDTVGLQRGAPGTFLADALVLSVAPDPEFHPWRMAGPLILVRDVADLRARLQQAGHPVEPVEGGGYIFDTQDPFGNRVRFAQF